MNQASASATLIQIVSPPALSPFPFPLLFSPSFPSSFVSEQERKASISLSPSGVPAVHQRATCLELMQKPPDEDFSAATRARAREHWRISLNILITEIFPVYCPC